MYLNCVKLSKSFRDRTLFSDASFTVEKGEIVGLIGANGVGKTTLFNIIMSKETPDSGSVLLSSGISVGYLEQHVCADSDRTAYEETLTVFSELFEIEASLERITSALAVSADEELILRQAELIEEYENRGGLTYVTLAHSVLSGLGFTPEEQNLPVSSLSGGQKSKIGLAKLLLQKPDVMLLDEPTNHLDIASVDWLEKFILNSKITAIVISHDRYFLDKICTKIVEIYTRKFYVTEGNYTRHMALKEERDLSVTRHYDNTMAEVKRIEGIIEQQRRWNKERNIRMAESKQKQIDRMLDGLEAPEHEKNDFSFNLSPATESANDVLSVEDLRMEFPGTVLYENVSFEVKKNDVIFIVGENGIGKTTLMKQILKKGRGVKFGVGVTIGYYDQHQLNLDLSKTIIDEVNDAFPSLSDTEVRSALARFGFKGDKVFDTLAILSGGERAKTALCKLMLKRCNFLFLDEPTNHLDIYSMAALENALLSYNGTLLIISHDRYFINRLASKVVELKPTGTITYIGDYDAYAEALLRSEELAANSAEAKPKARSLGSGGKDYLAKKQQRSEIAKLRSAIRTSEAEIERLESESERIRLALEDEAHTGDFEKITELSNELSKIDTQLSLALKTWEESSEKLAELESDND